MMGWRLPRHGFANGKREHARFGVGRNSGFQRGLQRGKLAEQVRTIIHDTSQCLQASAPDDDTNVRWCHLTTGGKCRYSAAGPRRMIGLRWLSRLHNLALYAFAGRAPYARKEVQSAQGGQ